jgi:hypothetical protein
VWDEGKISNEPQRAVSVAVAISALLAVRMECDRHVFACAVERVAGGKVIYSSIATQFESMCWNEAG